MLHTADPKVADTEEFARVLRDADAVWFNGGRQWNIVDSYANTLTYREFHKVLERGGVIGGSSAGATIQGDYLVRGEVAGSDVMMTPEPNHERAFKFLRHVAIDQHINTRNRWDNLIPVIKKYPNLLGIGLSEATAIIVNGDRFEVMGAWKVAIHDNTRLYQPWEKSFFVLSAGDVYNMKTRKVEKYGIGARGRGGDPGGAVARLQAEQSGESISMLLAVLASHSRRAVVAAGGRDPGPESVLRLSDRRRRRAGALSEDRRVPPAPLEDHQSRQVRGVGKTTMGNPYVLATISAPENLAKLDRLVEINRRLADPRGLTRGGREAAGAGRAGVLLRLRHDPLDRSRQHPVADRDRAPARDRHQPGDQADPRQRRRAAGAVAESGRAVPGHRSLVQDEGDAVHAHLPGPVPQVRRPRRQPRLVHVHAEGDAARASRSRTSTSRSSPTTCTSRDPADRGFSCRRSTIPTIRQRPSDHRAGDHDGRPGDGGGAGRRKAREASEWLTRYDLWAPARQYMVYHGQPRILSEIASVNLADPLVNADGSPMGPQEARWNFPMPYRKSTWRLRDIVDYGDTVAFAGMAHVAKYRTKWLENFYRIHADWVNRDRSAVRVRRPGDAARSVRDLRDARHPADR